MTEYHGACGLHIPIQKAETWLSLASVQIGWLKLTNLNSAHIGRRHSFAANALLCGDGQEGIP